MAKSIHNPEAMKEMLNRLGKLKENTPRVWGTMSPAAMLTHLSAQLRIALNDLKAEPEYPEIIQKVIKFGGLNFPWIRNMQAPKPMQISDTASFEVEKDSFIIWLNKFSNTPTNKSFKPHPFLGKLNHHEWGQLVYKHLDHHFRQFGI